MNTRYVSCLVRQDIWIFRSEDLVLAGQCWRILAGLKAGEVLHKQGEIQYVPTGKPLLSHDKYHSSHSSTSPATHILDNIPRRHQQIPHAVSHHVCAAETGQHRRTRTSAKHGHSSRRQNMKPPQNAKRNPCKPGVTFTSSMPRAPSRPAVPQVQTTT